MLLNASRFESVDSRPDLILLAIEDVTERKQAEHRRADFREMRYRRLFQTAQDGILILDANTLTDHRRQPVHDRVARLHYDEFVGKELVGDRAIQRLYKQVKPPTENCKLRTTALRYDHLPLETKKTASGPKSSSSATSIRWTTGPSLKNATFGTSASVAAWNERTPKKPGGSGSPTCHRRKDEFLAMLSHKAPATPFAPS